MTMEFSTTTVATIIGASIRQVDHWARKGVLKPSGCDASGKGSRRRWQFPDIVALQAIRELRAGGCPLPTIQKVVRHLVLHYPLSTPATALSRVRLFAFAGRVFMVDGDDRAIDVLSKQTTFCLPIGNLILETQRKVEAIPHRWAEKVIIAGRAFHFDVSRAGQAADYVVRCRELPGAIRHDQIAGSAIEALKHAVSEVIRLESGFESSAREHVSPRKTTATRRIS